MDVLIATATELSRSDDDEPPLRAALAAAGVRAAWAAWDDPSVDWGAARACVIKSTWNYIRHYPQFLAWVERCAAVTALWNPSAVVKWNSHKRYLLELEARGLPVVPTRLVEAGSAADLREIAADWSEVVIKPAVSAGSFGTMRVARAELAKGQAHLEKLLPTRDMLVQPYFPSVQTGGEHAVVWIDGAFTHEVRKGARFSGDPQRISAAQTIAPEEAAVAERILDAAPGPRLYARIDLVRDTRGRPHLMELELIEPALFLERSPPAAARFAGAVARILNASR